MKTSGDTTSLRGWYIHYGASKFIPELVKPVREDSFISYGSKPRGRGLWGSPVTTEGWRKWCESEDYNLDGLKDSFLFSLKEGSRVFVIDSAEDFKKRAFDPFVLVDGVSNLVLDYKSLVKEYDAILLTERGLLETRDLPIEMRWDCESILVFRSDSIVPEKQLRGRKS